MNKQDILQLADQNLAESVREMARWNSTGEIFEQHDLLLTCGADWSPATNFAICLNNRQGRSGSDLFNRIKSFYAERKSGFSIHIRKHADAIFLPSPYKASKALVCRRKQALKYLRLPKDCSSLFTTSLLPMTKINRFQPPCSFTPTP
jgi:hypothetical protein